MDYPDAELLQSTRQGYTRHNDITNSPTKSIKAGIFINENRSLTLITNVKFIPLNIFRQSTSSRKYIKFADGILEYESKIFAELLLNGLLKMKPNKLQDEGRYYREEMSC